MEFKRQMHASAHPRPVEQNPDIAALGTIGMRIRKAIADGYSTPSAAHYSYGGEPINNRRVPLPAGMDEPPSLMNSTGSTVGTASNLSSWESNTSVQTTTISDYQNSFFNGKRKLDLEQDSGYSKFRDDVDYTKKYGSLLFNEEF